MSGIMSLFVVLAFVTVTVFAMSTSSQKLLMAQYLGCKSLGKWLAILATTSLAFWLAVSALGLSYLFGKNLSLYPSFSRSELILFAMIVPILFTVFSPLASGLLLFYGAAKFFSVDYLSPSLVAFLCVSSFAFALADRLPWIKKPSSLILAYDKIKDGLIVGLSFIAIAEILLACLQYDSFLVWFASDFGVYPPVAILLIIAISLICGWTLVAIGYYRSLLLPVLSLGTIYAASFIEFMPLVLTNIFFFVGLAMTLSQPHRIGHPLRIKLA